jgi:catechol 2,3-dioxygenase-like lactoylglutathione lyase family enzyme
MTVRRIVVDHVLFVVSDLAASRRFYEAALAPLGFEVMYEEEKCVAFGLADADDFMICRDGTSSTAAHVAFVAESRDAVDRFFDAAMGAGGRAKHPPGLRPEYHPGYYGAYVWDPDGNNVEAVYHGAGDSAA